MGFNSSLYLNKTIFEQLLGENSFIHTSSKCQEFVHVVQSKFISPKRKSLSGRAGTKCVSIARIARKCWKVVAKESMTTKFIAKLVTEEILDQKDTDMVVALVL